MNACSPFPKDRFAQQRTPFYYYDTALLRRTLETLHQALRDRPSWRVHYAVKANFNPVLLRIIAQAGLGADCVSGGEIQAALNAGMAPESIFFAGVGKQDWEMELGLKAGIGRFNVESVPELMVLNDLAAKAGVVAPVSLRVNPDIGAHTMDYIATGRAENKFGIHHRQIPEVAQLCCALPNIHFCGLHFHVGSQILDMADFEVLCYRVCDLLAAVRHQGIAIQDVNVGGGLGIDYDHPDLVPIAGFGAYFHVFKRLLPADIPVHFELGRSIVGPCGSLISRVLFVKEGVTRQFAIIDASMTQLIRPALYQARHCIQNLSSTEPIEAYDVVGPVCETADIFAKAAVMPRCHRGDLVAIRSAGAYGESMASHYNSHPLPDSLFDQ